jgi:hypothetical protein
MPYYRQHQQNQFSQNGEDGILDVLLKELGVSTPVCCEYGAHDGIHASNTRRLLLDRGARVLYVESDTDRYHDLLLNIRDYPLAIAENCAVRCFDSDEGVALQNILCKHNYPIDFDLLSVDIDGFDHASLDYMGEYKPKIIVIEIDSGKLPTSPQQMKTNESNFNFKSSCNYLNHKGYDVVIHTGNMIAVRRDLIAKLSLPKDEINSDLLFDARWCRSL